MRRLLALGLGCLVSVTASSEDLLTIFDQAVVNDPQVREAEYTRKATREAKPQAWAAYLPQIGGRWTKAKRDITRSSVQPFARYPRIRPIRPPRPSSSRRRARTAPASPDTETWGLQLNQSIFNWGQLVGLKQAGRVVAQADADYGVAQQDLALRVATRYFDVLAAQDNVQAQQASLDAISRQLEQADKRFEVGLIAITDVQEARAARDTVGRGPDRRQASARHLAGVPARDHRHAVRRCSPRRAPPCRCTMPEPADAEKWVRGLDGAEPGAHLEPSRRRHRARRRARGLRRPPAAGGPGGRQVAFRDRRDRDFRSDSRPQLPRRQRGLHVRTATPTSRSLLQVTVPIWSSGGTHSRVKQSEYRWQAAKQRLERVSRETERTARDAYLGVDSEISRVQALKQALESSATALQATEAGYDVGTRTAVDVLAARRTLVAAQTAYSRSRYDYMLNVLHAQAGGGHPRSQGARGRERLARRPPPPPADASAAIDQATPPRADAAEAVATGSSGSRKAIRRLDGAAVLLDGLACRSRPCAVRAAGLASNSPMAVGQARARRRTMRTAPHSTSSRATSAELKLLGPASTGNPSEAGSSRLCPPIGTRLPPTNATSPAA